MQQKQRVRSLDDFRWIGAALVVAIHTSPLESVNGTADFLLTRVFARVAVPFFFMVTGFFLLADERNRKRNIVRAMRKNGILYLLLTLLYLPIQCYKLFSSGGITQQTGTTILRDIFFDGTFYHLWYFPALLLGLPLAGLFLRLGKKNAVAVAGALYVFGMLGDSYYGITERIPALKIIYDGLFSISSYTRNGLFFAPLFLILGAMAADAYREERQWVHKWREAAICMVFLCGEGLILHHYGFQRHDSMYVILPLEMVCLFGALLSVKGRETPVSAFYEKGPMLIYFLHPYVIILLRGGVKLTHWTAFLSLSPLYYVTVLLGSAVLAWICVRPADMVRKGKTAKRA